MLQNETLFGHTYNKPFGYAGDFLLIEKIYQKFESENSFLCKWDRFYHSHEATEAVRNRKKYFIDLMNEMSADGNLKKVLILGSGPATDVHEFLCHSKGKAEHIHFDMLDIDQNAVDYATEKNKSFLNQLNFIRANVFKYESSEKYDLIWSAGLFDYVDDVYFKLLLKKYLSNLKTDGEMIIGNFSTDNPTRKVMEVMTEWFLYHRDATKLLDITRDSGIGLNRAEVEREPLGINLFLRIK